MRIYESDPIEVAASALEEAARKYAGAYLQAGWSAETETASSKLRQAATNYALATAPKQRKRRPAPEKGKGST